MPKKPTNVSGRFGRIVVIHCNLPPRKRVLVKCDCGKEFAVTSHDLLSGRTTSCGGSECSSRANHLHGQRFGNLIVSSLSKTKNNRGELIWICRCDCGRTRKVKTNNLLKGLVKSCGCQKDILRSRSQTKPLEGVAARTIWCRYKKGAEYRHLSFDLSPDDVKSYMAKNCHYCNSKPNNIFVAKNICGDRELLYSGIHRINSNFGYITENCVPCCKISNMAKSDVSVVEFLNWAHALVMHQNKLGENHV